MGVCDDNTPTSISMGNLAKLHEIYSFLKRSGCPYIIGADWNMLGSLLCGLSWLDDIAGDIVAPSHLDFTCTSGTGRAIDFFVVDRRLVPIITDVDRDPGADWKPHVGLTLTVVGAPKSVRIRKFAEPGQIRRHSLAKLLDDGS